MGPKMEPKCPEMVQIIVPKNGSALTLGLQICPKKWFSLDPGTADPWPGGMREAIRRPLLAGARRAKSTARSLPILP